MESTIFNILSLIILIEIAMTAPINNENSIRLLDFDHHLEQDGNFHYNFTLTDGHREYKQGTLKDVNGVKVVVAEGKFGYIGPDFAYYEITYIADENGFVVKNFTRECTYSGGGQISPKAIASLLSG